MWLYNDSEVTDELLANKKSFVYLITNTVTGKKYIGKKKLTFFRKKAVKGKKRKVKVIKESDWRTYFGSSNDLLADKEKYGEDKFKREIIRICDTSSEASYWELWHQMKNHVLLNDDYYNSYVGARIHRSHVNKK